MTQRLSTSIVRTKAVPLEYGTIFGRLTVLERITNTTNGNARYRCGCACGYSKVKARGNDLRSGKVTQCLRCKSGVSSFGTN